MSNGNFFAELKRRNVYKVVITYAVIAWLLIEVASMILASNDAPPWVLTAFVIFLALGLFIVAMISWSFEATPEGLKRTKDVPPDAVLPTWSRRKHTTFLLVVAAMAGDATLTPSGDPGPRGLLIYIYVCARGAALCQPRPRPISIDVLSHFR